MKQMSEKTRGTNDQGDEGIDDMKEELKFLKSQKKDLMRRLTEFYMKWQLNEEEIIRKVTVNVLDTRGK